MKTPERPRRLPGSYDLHQSGLLLGLSLHTPACEVLQQPHASVGCMEQLLVQCAAAIEAHDASSAQQLMWELSNVAPSDGDHGRRLAAGFLRALFARAVATGCFKGALAAELAISCHRFSAVDLARFLDLTPWHRFGYTAANGAIADAVGGFPAVHVVDLSTTHCMQIPTLIDSLANCRPESPPHLRVTVPISAYASPPPPVLATSYDELGARLIAFASTRNMNMEFAAVPSTPADSFDALLRHARTRREGEALVVNCQMLPHRVPDALLRDLFLNAVRSLEPTLVTLVDEDVDLVQEDLVGRLRSAYNYFWIPLDAADACLPKDGGQWRRWYEEGVTWKIENVVAAEGMERVERQERRGRWKRRMVAAGFRSVGFREEAEAEGKAVLAGHAAAWGMRKEKEDGEETLMLTWKGHEVVFATAWAPF